jgi:hypothetical protein
VPTQAEISAHLDLDQSAVSRWLNDAGISWRVTPLDDIRVAYIRQIRAQAAGHRSENGDDLVAERVKTERVQRELMLLNLHEKQGALINVAQLQPMYSQMVAAFKTEILALPDKAKSELDALYGINVDVELLNAHVRAALEQLSRYDPGDPSDADGAGAEPAPA